MKYIYSESQKSLIQNYTKPLEISSNNEDVAKVSKLAENVLETFIKLESNLIRLLNGLYNCVSNEAEDKIISSNLKSTCYSALKDLAWLYFTEDLPKLHFKKRDNLILSSENIINIEAKKRADEVRSDIRKFLKSKSKSIDKVDSHLKLSHINELESKCAGFVNFYENLILVEKKGSSALKDQAEKEVENMKFKTGNLNKIVQNFLVNSEDSIIKLKVRIHLERT